MSCVLEILSLQELIIRKENLLKQLKLVENQILKKEYEELLINKEDKELLINKEDKELLINKEDDEMNIKEDISIEKDEINIKNINKKKIILINNTSNKPIKNIIKIIKRSVEEKIAKLPETKNIKIKIIPKSNL
jgi:hypothetical protein